MLQNQILTLVHVMKSDPVTGVRCCRIRLQQFSIETLQANPYSLAYESLLYEVM